MSMCGCLENSVCVSVCVCVGGVTETNGEREQGARRL